MKTKKRVLTVSKSELVSDIKRVARKVKDIPNRREYREFGKHGSSTYERKYGSWSEVLRHVKANKFSWSRK